MFNGQAAAAAGWAWYGATAAGTAPHLVIFLLIMLDYIFLLASYNSKFY
jgi:hypothetical protein